MITQEKINLYKQCHGNYKIWKAAKGKQIEINEKEWLNMEALLFCCYLNHIGLNYVAFTVKLQQKLTAICDGETTISTIKELACSVAYKTELLGQNRRSKSPHQLAVGQI